MKYFALTIVAALPFAWSQLQAHHSSSGFDREARVTIQGRIDRYEWVNPHVYLWIEADDGDGGLVTWEIEGHPPAILRRLGWTPDTVKVGDFVTVQGNPGRDRDAHIALMDSFEKAETVMDLTAVPIMTALSDDTATARTDTLAGTWVTVFQPEIYQVLSPQNIKTTERGREAMESYVEAIDSPSLDCIPFTAPMLMVTPDVKSFEFTDDAIVLRADFDSIERTIHLDVDSHEGAAESVQGHSIGRFDGNALVVDTTHFAPHRSLTIGMGLPSGRQRHLLERFELSEEGTHLTYSFELDDPEYLTETISGSVQWAYRPEIEYSPIPCDIDNARRFTRE